MVDPFTRLDRLARQGDLAGVERVVRESMEGADERDRPDLLRYLAWAAFEQGRFEDAVEAAREAGERLAEAKALVQLWEFERAAEVLDAFDSEEIDDLDDLAQAAWYRAILDEFAGRDPTAQFERAAELAPDLFAPPARLSDAEVDGVVRDALGSLPPLAAREVADAVVVLADLPEPHPDTDPLSLGLYLGVNLAERSLDDAPRLPARIEVYRRNIERFAVERDDVIEELRITLLHEIGHHLGYEEEDLERLGYD